MRRARSEVTQAQINLAALMICEDSARRAARVLAALGSTRTDLVVVYEVAGKFFLDLAKKAQEKT